MMVFRFLPLRLKQIGRRLFQNQPESTVEFVEYTSLYLGRLKNWGRERRIITILRYPNKIPWGQAASLPLLGHATACYAI